MSWLGVWVMGGFCLERLRVGCVGYGRLGVFSSVWFWLMRVLMLSVMLISCVLVCGGFISCRFIGIWLVLRFMGIVSVY